jgi:uncharacterized membrane protein YfcA
VSGLQLASGLVVYAIGCTLQGVLGFGAGLFAVPILALIHPDFVPGPVLMMNPLLSGLLSVRERGSVDHQGLRWALTGRVPGVLLGVLALTMVAEERLGVLFGVLLLLSVALKASGVHTGRTPRSLMVAGGLSGFMGTTVAVGGPPIALAFHDLPGPVMRATLSIYFLVGTTISLVVLALAGQFGTSDMLLAAWLVLPAMVGVALSGPLRAPLDRGWLAPAVYVLSSVAAVVLLVRSLA